MLIIFCNFSQNFTGHPNSHDIRRNIFVYYTSCPNNRVVPDCNTC